MIAETITTGVVARRIGVAARTVREAMARGIGAPSVRPRKQGSPGRWTEDDVTLFTLALSTRRALLALVDPAQRAVQRLRSTRASICVAVGPRGVVLVKRRGSVDAATRRVGWPCILVAADVARSSPR